ncbi:hypothetical protein CR513_42904, partial [Mucuna pruriens]
MKGDGIVAKNFTTVASRRGRSGRDEEYQEFLRLKSNNHTQSSTSPSVSTTCISHSMGSQGPWIIDSGASDHISGNDSVFSSFSSPKFPHFISFANGSKMVSQGVGRDKLSARAIKCVFLGYSRLQKGYRCYSPSTKRHYISADVTFFEETMFFTKDDCGSIQQALPIPYLSPPESSSLETHNQDILQPSSSIHSQVELSPPSMSTCQSRTQEMGTPVCEDSLDSCPLPSTDPTPNPLPSSPSHDSDIGWPIALQK